MKNSNIHTPENDMYSPESVKGYILDLVGKVQDQTVMRRIWLILERAYAKQ